MVNCTSTHDERHDLLQFVSARLGPFISESNVLGFAVWEPVKTFKQLGKILELRSQ